MVAAVPEGLPLVASVAQLAAARRLSARGALVRNPRTIEALGRVDTLCFDKTGTLTVGAISLQRVSDGDTNERIDEMGPRSRAVLAAALRASPGSASDTVADLPHATDRAVLVGAHSVGVSAADGLDGWDVLGQLAFDPARGYHAVVGRGPVRCPGLSEGRPRSDRSALHVMARPGGPGAARRCGPAPPRGRGGMAGSARACGSWRWPSGLPRIARRWWTNGSARWS